MQLQITICVLAIVAYFVGSLPFGLLVGLLKGVDIRRQGSGNTGATNAGRVLGKRYFYLVLLLDAGKGLVPTLLAREVLLASGLLPDKFVLASGLWLLVGFAAVAGHNWPVYLKFKGGKGVATSLGMVLAVYPYYTYPGLAALVIWIIVVAITRYVSAGSMLAAVGFVCTYATMIACWDGWNLREQWLLLAFATAMAIVLIVRHRSNISRLRSGKENKY